MNSSLTMVWIKSFEKKLEYVSVGLCIFGAILTTFDIIPFNKWALFLGTFGWMILGIIWGKKSLILNMLCFTIIYFYGTYISVGRFFHLNY